MTIDIEQLRSDMEAGTDGPWINAEGSIRSRSGVPCVSVIVAANENPEADARRIARLPDLEQAYLDLREQNRKLREVLREIAEIKPHHAGQTPNEYHFQQKARAALAEGGE